ncbi:hypothetical protein [Clostridium sp. CF012]|uniref:hypothetical protein n=1 Tax=Clostridium sp. CF012 TaxID=2843319 RepID=UPI001C0BD144|nr:hypothetical protein [Clostridium sp. CF012]MBU3146269.1 hypothetical protein [Clostridium sp. CF012]
MYDYRSKDFENLGQNMPMKDMPMKDMPMTNMPMPNMPMMCMPMICMPMMYMPMMNMPMYDEDDEYDEDDKDLKSMYPKIYMRIHPMVKHHCDMLESIHGTMYCPSKEEMDHMCKEICDKYEEKHKDDDDRNDNNDMRQILGLGRRGPIEDLTRVLFIRDLLGRRRRRRRMFDHGSHHGSHHGY